MSLLILVAIICLIGWLENKWSKYALIVWIIQKTDTQPSKEEMIECKKFVIQQALNDLRKPKL